MNKLITGGLVGFSNLLALLGSDLWWMHACAAAVSFLSVLAQSRVKLFRFMPFIALLTVFFVAWF